MRTISLVRLRPHSAAKFAFFLVIIVREDRTPPQTRHKVGQESLPCGMLCESCEGQSWSQQTPKARLLRAIDPIRNTQCDRTSVARAHGFYSILAAICCESSSSKISARRGHHGPSRRYRGGQHPPYKVSFESTLSSWAFAALPRLLHSAT